MPWLTGLWLILPMIFSGIAHMIIVKLDLFANLKIPVSIKLFGANKTWRGFVVMIFASWLGVVLVSQLELNFNIGLDFLFSNFQSYLIGPALGFAYAFAELPNSFFKRRLGVAPGQLPTHNRWVFFLMDHFDSLTGCCLVFLIFDINAWPSVLALFVLAPSIHTLINFGLWKLSIRNNPF